MYLIKKFNVIRTYSCIQGAIDNRVYITYVHICFGKFKIAFFQVESLSKKKKQKFLFAKKLRTKLMSLQNKLQNT